ncbi:MAG: hypothetical protein LBE38_10845 [Deltaproteobacteria bacterium]|jgi:membrane associated rhomboid family serine protease|nr:hypothetical protein [Deltaproteobacteria bacterium]
MSNKNEGCLFYIVLAVVFGISSTMLKITGNLNGVTGALCGIFSALCAVPFLKKDSSEDKDKDKK